MSSDEDVYYQASLLDGQYSLSVIADYYHSYSLNDIIINGSLIKINIALDRFGSFSGTVKDDSGLYAATGLNSGKYYVRTYSQVYINQWYDGVYELSKAKLVNVIINQNTTNINFTLSMGSSISGFVKDEYNNSLSSANVLLADSLFNVLFYGNTDNSGQYSIKGLPPAIKYFVSAISDGFVQRWYNNVSTPDSAAPIILLPEENRNNINFNLHTAGMISGRVLDNLGVPVSYVDVNVEDSLGLYYHYGYTDYYGNYSVSNLPTGKYYASVNDYIHAHSFYYSSSGVIYFEDTRVGNIVPVTDPVGDVPFDFIDIVSAGWNLKTIDNITDSNIMPVDFKLEQNFPNPFNPSTTIRYALPYESNVKIIVYNLLGQVVKQVVSEVQKTGYHEVNFNADNLASGVYFYSVVANSTSNRQDFKGVKKMLLLK